MGERVVRKVTPAVKNYEREREGREIGRASTAVRESNAVVGKNPRITRKWRNLIHQTLINGSVK